MAMLKVENILKARTYTPAPFENKSITFLSLYEIRHTTLSGICENNKQEVIYLPTQLEVSESSLNGKETYFLSQVFLDHPEILKDYLIAISQITLVRDPDSKIYRIVPAIKKTEESYTRTGYCTLIERSSFGDILFNHLRSGQTIRHDIIVRLINKTVNILQRDIERLIFMKYRGVIEKYPQLKIEPQKPGNKGAGKKRKKGKAKDESVGQSGKGTNDIRSTNASGTSVPKEAPVQVD